MQKRSSTIAIHYLPIRLVPEFAMLGGAPYQQHDREIRHLHFHSCLELGYCYSGSGIFMIGEKILPFSTGDVSVIFPNEVHLAQSAAGTTSEWTWIYVDPFQLLMQAGPGAAASMRRLSSLSIPGNDFNNMLSTRQHPSAARVVLDMVDELRNRRASYQEALRALTWQLMVLLQRLVRVEAGEAASDDEDGAGAEKDVSPAGSAPSSASATAVAAARHAEYDRVVPALQHVAQCYAQAVSIGHLAALCHMSEPHFRRVFLRAMGQTPRAYWHAVRLGMAASLLHNSSRSVLEISQAVGFETLSSFNRLFLKHFHKPPRRWRAG